MMKPKLETALSTIAHAFQDRRTQHCRVTVVQAAESHCELAGTVLDAETLTAVSTHLHTQFPTLTIDVTDVRVLRGPDNPVLTVQTNLAGLHGKPGRTSELWSQLLNGWQVEQLQQEGDWLYVRRSDGYLGWAYAPYLADLPAQPKSHLVCEPVAYLQSEPAVQAGLVSRLLGGTAVTVTGTNNEWAAVSLAGDKAGWLPQSSLRPLAALPEDENGRRQQIVTDALTYIGVPYLWGGISAHGIDCSGLAQLVHCLVDITLPRDADMQFDTGKPVNAPFQPGDLLFFGSEKGHRSISHVGISLGDWQMIHASGPRNGVYVDDVQAANWLRDSFLGARTFLERE